MSGKRPWDDLHGKSSVDDYEQPRKVVVEETRGFEADSKNIAKHAFFGGTIGGITGLSISGFELMRDPRAMARGNMSVATKKISKFAGGFGAWFAYYHTVRKTVDLYFPKAADFNTNFAQISGIAGTAAMTPLVVIPKLRHMVPYGTVLLLLDNWNQWNDND